MDVSNVTSMKSFNQQIDGWDVGKVILMEYMFTVAASFNQRLAAWDISQVTSMEMFRG
jgi:hypothetical protein